MHNKTVIKNTLLFLFLIFLGLTTTFLSISGMGRDYVTKINESVADLKTDLFSSNEKRVNDVDFAINITKTPNVASCGGEAAETLICSENSIRLR